MLGDVALTERSAPSATRAKRATVARRETLVDTAPRGSRGADAMAETRPGFELDDRDDGQFSVATARLSASRRVRPWLAPPGAVGSPRVGPTNPAAERRTPTLDEGRTANTWAEGR